VPLPPAPTLTLERLTESSHGQLLYELPHPRRDGATHLLLDPLELIEKLTVLIPPPRFHLLRFHGVLAPRAQLRAAVVPRSSRDAALGGAPAPRLSPPAPQSPPVSGAGRLSWAALMRRVFEIDVLLCRCCGGRRRIVAVYPGGPRLRELLDRLGLSQPPGRPPPRESLTSTPAP
jgi:Putative transposase